MIPRDYEEPVSFWEWVRAHLILIVPGLGLVMLIYWAFSDHTKTSKRNFARSQLFFMLPLVILGVGLLSFAAIPAIQKARDAAIAKAEANARDQSGGNAFDPATAPSTSAPPPDASTSAFAPAAVPASNPPAGAASAAGSAIVPPPASSAPPTLTPDEPTRSLRSADGRVIEARVISLTDDDVTIMRVNGQEFTVPMSRFAPEDVAYFMRLRNGRDAFD